MFVDKQTFYKYNTSTNKPSGVNILQLGPLLHFPKQFTLTTGIEDGVRNLKVAIVASDPFSLHLFGDILNVIFSSFIGNALKEISGVVIVSNYCCGMYLWYKMGNKYGCCNIKYSYIKVLKYLKYNTMIVDS